MNYVCHICYAGYIFSIFFMGYFHTSLDFYVGGERLRELICTGIDNLIFVIRVLYLFFSLSFCVLRLSFLNIHITNICGNLFSVILFSRFYIFQHIEVKSTINFVVSYCSECFGNRTFFCKIIRVGKYTFFLREYG